MDRLRLRGWLVICSLGGAAIAASCGRDSPIGIQRPLITDPSKYAVWDPDPSSCWIGNKEPWGEASPLIDTTCGVIVTQSIPPMNDPNLWQENYFYWVHNQPGGYPPRFTGYLTGVHNTNLNGPIKYTFSQPIAEFWMQAQHQTGPYYDSIIGPGHYMKAFSAVTGGTLIDSVSFGGEVVDVRELIDTTGLGIRRVEVYAPTVGPSPLGDYSIPEEHRLVRQAVFQVGCPPTGDPVLDQRSVRDSMRSLLQRSGPNAAPGSGQKLERGAIIWEKPDGTHELEELFPPDVIQTECRWEPITPMGGFIPPVSGWLPAGFIHSHPRVANEVAYGCLQQPGQPPTSQFPGDGLQPATTMPDGNGGGSDADWDYATNSTFPQYVITKSGRISRLDPNTARGNRPGNTNRWRTNNPAYPGCFVP